MGINTIKKVNLISKRVCYYENTLYLIIIFHQFTINVHSTIIDL